MVGPFQIVEAFAKCVDASSNVTQIPCKKMIKGDLIVFIASMRLQTGLCSQFFLIGKNCGNRSSIKALEILKKLRRKNSVTFQNQQMCRGLRREHKKVWRATGLNPAGKINLHRGNRAG